MQALSKYDILKKHWNFTQFRNSQEAIIDAALSGNPLLAILPTGGGKSLCYQLPAVMMSGTALVISPLIALMIDQVDNLNKKDIPAVAIHSGLNKESISDILEDAVQSKFKLIYVSPERIHSELFKSYLPDINWSILAIDEAHCISQWGHDFRPLYREIPSLYQLATFKNIIALTASATPYVKQDILKQLSIPQALRFQESIIRDNLFYEVKEVLHKAQPLLDLTEAQTQIIYCPTRKKTEEVAYFLQNNQKQALAFHAGLSNKEKEYAQQSWMQSETMTMCATSAFGMGIDKPNVRKVIHHTIPQSLEAYYQEAGRAGRDRIHAKAIALFSPNDLDSLEKSVDYKFPEIAFIHSAYEIIMNHLQIAVGEGAETHRFFNPVTVAQTHNISILHFLSAIKIIEQNKYWVWNQDDQSFHFVVFEANRAEIASLKTINITLHEFAIELLRMYGEIMHYKTKIDLVQIAQFTDSTYEKVLQQLNNLHQMDIIRYTPAQKGSALFLLEDRLPKVLFGIDKQKYQFLKTRYIEQIQAITNYILDTHNCRNVILAQYFGEDNVKDCQHCDNCIRKNNHPHHKRHLQAVTEMIQMKREINIQDLMLAFPELDQQILILHLQNLANEQIVKIQGTNIIFAK